MAVGKEWPWGSSAFDVYWGSSLLATFDGGHVPLGSFTFLADATTAQTMLRFQNQMSGFTTCGCGDDWNTLVRVDNVSVRQLVATPEPSTWMLVAGGLLVLGAVPAGRRRHAVLLSTMRLGDARTDT